MLIYDPQTQDTHSGGSGCGCAASVLAGYILPGIIQKKKWKRILFVPTGALLSKVSFNEGGSNSRYRTRCCNRAVQGSGYDVDTEIFFRRKKYMDYFNAFWTGGLICALVQILLDRTKLMPGRIMVLLVCTGSVLSAVGIYQPFAEFAGAGASVPLLGFGNILWKGMKESIDKNGLIGLFMGGFTACAVGSLRSFDLLLSCKPDLQAQNERITYHE